MPVIDCPAQGCGFSTPDIEALLAVEVLKIHGYSHVPAAAAPQHVAPVGGAGGGGAGGVKPEKPKKPQLYMEGDRASEESWGHFLHQWGRYKTLTNMQDDVKSDHLQDCLPEEVSRLRHL